ncbi:retropepsin-like aspartic protease [Mesonia sp. K4-1]|jgi:predicted aspartyl protease|uniref:retropepsin-like aspartic protease n=1 Tax=Mesonia sp. K4-1 TaxID=2602760 RepID=UPI0011C991CE|nr:retropepsin-like aspartic protease [Mesonia sp. K4-1]TXK75794.1 acid protease [Mesonia sp. K4-1]
MSTLRKLMKEKGYTRIKLKTTATSHLELKAKINKVEGNFILDTGASSSCVGLDTAEYFKLFAEESDVKAAGAGATDMLTQVSLKNELKIKDWKKKKVSLVLFDLSHVNQALENHNADQVHGIIGADMLEKGKAVIDYKSNCLYLK